MGDRFYLKLNCAYCGKENPKQGGETWEDEFIYYAPTCGFTDFMCHYCGEKNLITQNFKAIKNETPVKKDTKE